MDEFRTGLVLLGVSLAGNLLGFVSDLLFECGNLFFISLWLSICLLLASAVFFTVSAVKGERRPLKIALIIVVLSLLAVTLAYFGIAEPNICLMPQN